VCAMMTDGDRKHAFANPSDRDRWIDDPGVFHLCVLSGVWLRVPLFAPATADTAYLALRV
jgi:hypothetical protein